MRGITNTTGLNKIEIAKKLGEDKVLELRRSWNIKPDPLSKSSYHPINIDTYKNVPGILIPDTESLKDTFERVVKFIGEIKDKLKNNNILISAHGNSIRAMNIYLNLIIIKFLNWNTYRQSLMLSLNNNFDLKDCEYLDKERSKDLLIF